MIRHVIVTGAGGRIGSAVVRELRDHGIRTTGLVVEGTSPADDTLLGDAGDPRAVDRAITHALDHSPVAEVGIAHLAAIPSPGEGLAEEVFGNNTAATFAVLEAAGRAGIGRAVIASSVSVLGFAWGSADLRPHYLPMDEQHPVLAEDPYALSKWVDECTTVMMHRRWGTTIVALRLPFVADGERLAARQREAAADPAALRAELWGWLHTDDAGRAFRLALTAPTSRATTITVTAPESLSDVPTADLLRTYLPDVPTREELPDRTVPYDLTRAREILGFTARRRLVRSTPITASESLQKGTT
ncbi:NAD-dependent epimerase/dehydratase family protein [Ruania alba]|uniref:Nucleoside-diphosphate-sugar epimerase n=1 Tax=Ruania alba TaxID=648782 RepID=A0A1H5K9P6_9MICO|nr:NAD(P)-dependent oxidoreductase [Ruania alba]SEE61449.1 Nucleoside-diphosphate-sugar epimerase [Ruania alba]